MGFKAGFSLIIDPKPPYYRGEPYHSSIRQCNWALFFAGVSSLMEVDEFGFRAIKSDGIIVSPFESSFGDVLELLAVLLFTFSYDQACNIIYIYLGVVVSGCFC